MKAISALACLLLCAQVLPAADQASGKSTASAAKAEQTQKAAAAQPSPKTMTKLVVHMESAEVKAGSFASQPRTFYRSGERYCRIEEAADPDNGVQGVVIMNDPNVWTVNLVSKTGRHMLSSAETLRCRLPIFTPQQLKTAPDLKNPLLDLEFGRELEFFKKQAGKPQPGPERQGKPTNLYSAKIGDSELLLFSAGTPEAPVAVILKKGASEYTYTYDSYEQLPFATKLFSKPEGFKIREPVKAKQKAGEAKENKPGSDAQKPEANKPQPAQTKS